MGVEVRVRVRVRVRWESESEMGEVCGEVVDILIYFISTSVVLVLRNCWISQQCW